MNFLRKLCCCKGGDEDDENYLIRNDDDEEHHRDTHSSVLGHSLSANGMPPGNRLTPPMGNGADATRSREQEETALLNRILHTAQERIIDVNLDDNVGEVDVTQRSRVYSEAVRKHDAKRKKNNEDLAPLGHLLTDSGAEAQAVLLLPQASANDLSFIFQATRDFAEAVRADVGIRPKEQLVVYMDQLDS